MSDARLRQLEQRWKETGSAEDEAAYLVERLRHGQIEKSRLQLLAYCGDEAARLALGPEAPEASAEFKEWSVGFGVWGKVSCLSAALAAAECCLENAREVDFYATYPTYLDPTPSMGDRLLTGLAVARAWLDCPCERHARLARERVPEIDGVFFQTREMSREERLLHEERCDIGRALTLASGFSEDDWELPVVSAAVIVGAQLIGVQDVGLQHTRRLSETVIRDAILRQFKLS